MNYCCPSCFALNSAASRAGLIICVNMRAASPLSSILKLCPSLLSPRHPADHNWQLLLLIVRVDKVFLLHSQRLIPHARMAQITVGADMGAGRRSVMAPFLPWTHFSAPRKASVRHLLVVKVIYPQSCCLVVASMAIGAARLTITADLSASSAVRLWISSDDNEDATGPISF